MTNPTNLREAVERLQSVLEIGHPALVHDAVAVSRDDLRLILSALEPDEEKVARAIEDDRSQRHYGIPGDWDGMTEYHRAERIFAARAAIASIFKEK